MRARAHSHRPGWCRMRANLQRSAGCRQPDFQCSTFCGVFTSTIPWDVGRLSPSLGHLSQCAVYAASAMPPPQKARWLAPKRAPGVRTIPPPTPLSTSPCRQDLRGWKNDLAGVGRHLVERRLRDPSASVFAFLKTEKNHATPPDFPPATSRHPPPKIFRSGWWARSSQPFEERRVVENPCHLKHRGSSIKIFRHTLPRDPAHRRHMPAQKFCKLRPSKAAPAPCFVQSPSCLLAALCGTKTGVRHDRPNASHISSATDP